MGRDFLKKQSDEQTWLNSAKKICRARVIGQLKWLLDTIIQAGKVKDVGKRFSQEVESVLQVIIFLWGKSFKKLAELALADHMVYAKLFSSTG